MRSLVRLRRSTRRSVLRLNLAVGVYFRRSLVYFRRHRAKFYSAASAVSLILAAILFGRAALQHRSELKIYSESLSTAGILPQLGIAVGAAMLGVIGIVFSLSLFSIQQVAERGTTLTLREYANDWVLRVVYWSLAGFALFAAIAALLRKSFSLFAMIADLVILSAAILLLKIYFNRAIKFSNPNFTVSRIAKRGRRFLKEIGRMERSVEVEVRYARRKGKS
jgi:hypothetical protein